MRWEIEKSGCCEHKGMVQVRICFYLEPGDARYDEHHVEVSVLPADGYPGEKDESGRPKPESEYAAWVQGLPREWRVNPFHNHFLYVDPETPDSEIATIADGLLSRFYAEWSSGETPGRGLPRVRRIEHADSRRIASCERRAEEIRQAEWHL